MPGEVAAAAGLLERHAEGGHELFVSDLEFLQHEVHLQSLLSLTLARTHGSVLH